MYHTHLKSEEKFQYKYQDVLGSKNIYIHTDINEYKYGASLLGKKELNQNAKCSQKRD
jgi:hypothetical protein